MSVWITQDRRDHKAYALVLKYQINGAKKVIVCDDDTFHAKITSTRFWFPDPEPISEDRVPQRILDKILKKQKEIKL